MVLNMLVEKSYCVILCSNLDLIDVLFLLFYSNPSFFKFEFHVLSYLNMKYSRYNFIIEGVNL